MDMNLTSAAQTAELLASLGVLASLVFVGVELHRVTEATLREELDTPGGRDWWARARPPSVFAEEMAELIDGVLGPTATAPNP